jgi:hypothetical protein
MTLLTEQQYREFTGDQSLPISDVLTIAGCLDWAERKLQEYLGRYISSAERTETLDVDKYGKAYPAAVPVTSLPSSAVGSITLLGDDCIVFGDVWGTDLITDRVSWGDGDHTETVVYTGGFVYATAPAALVEGICALTYWKAHTRYNPADQKANATQIRVGDVALGFDARTRRGGLDQMVPGLTSLVKGLHLGRL